jgi:hypothetical protein
MPLGGAQARIETDAQAVPQEPFSARADIPGVLRLRRHAGEPHVIAQLVNEPRLIVLQIASDVLHI